MTYTKSKLLPPILALKWISFALLALSAAAPPAQVQTNDPSGSLVACERPASTVEYWQGVEPVRAEAATGLGDERLNRLALEK